jgi:hypothetical protein
LLSRSATLGRDRQPDHFQPARERLQREGTGVVERDAEELEGVDVRCPRRREHGIGDGERLLKSALNRPAVRGVLEGLIAQKTRTECDVTVLVAGDEAEALDESRQGSLALVVIDDEVLSG